MREPKNFIDVLDDISFTQNRLQRGDIERILKDVKEYIREQGGTVKDETKIHLMSYGEIESRLAGVMTNWYGPSGTLQSGCPTVFPNDPSPAKNEMFVHAFMLMYLILCK